MGGQPPRPRWSWNHPGIYSHYYRCPHDFHNVNPAPPPTHTHTPKGDMYSFGVIMVDILTHESPFNDYLDYLEVDEILDAVAGRKKITAQLPQAWPRSGSSQNLRPTITEDCDPAYKDVC